MTQENALPSVPALLETIAREMHVAEGHQIVHVETLEATQSAYAVPSPPLPPELDRSLRATGVQQLYTHQVEAIERVRRGENVVVVTATSSGKTLCYNLPVLESILADRSTRALYLYPINALVNDQLKSLFRLNLGLGKGAVSVARYTGSLESDQRKVVRERQPSILLTNPEMLHLSLLLWHELWSDLWKNLRYIVIDEVHTYRGVFGSNMAQLFRRTLRMAEHYGAAPQFICCSATIANPQELAEHLTGRPFSVIDRNGAGRGRRYFALWNPPLEQGNENALRHSYTAESVALLLHCVRAHYNTIVFARARGLTERMLRLSRGQPAGEAGNPAAADGDAALAERISAYRAGYLAEEREEIENRLKSGELLGVITTNALELGIDIGSLDAAIISGYPGTIMSTWQQAGRAGRRGRDALIVLVASQNPLDQYYMRHPRVFFAQPHELAVVDQENPYIRLKHLLCAARELPLSPQELAQTPPALAETLDALRAAELLVPVAEGEGLTYPKSRRDIHFSISLRAASHETYQILNEQRLEIGTIEPPNVFREAHPGAIYQHSDDNYRVTYLDRQRHTVRVREEPLPHYTRANSVSTLRVEQIYTTQQLAVDAVNPLHGPVSIALGDVLVQETILGYQELTLATNEMVRRVNLDYPLTITLHTTAMWITIPPELATLLAPLAALEAAAPVTGEEPAETEEGEGQPFVAGLHAIEHLLTGVMPLLVMCDRRDVDGYHHVLHPDLQAPAIFVYDAYEGGIGLAEIAYQRAEELLRLAHDTVTRCECKMGCPACIQSGVCRLRNASLDKAAAIALLAAILPPTTAQDAEQPRTSAAPIDKAGPDIQLPSMSTSLPASSSDPRSLGRQRALREILELTRHKTVYEHVGTPDAPVATEPTHVAFTVGDWVEQSPYGRGQVQAVRKEGGHQILVIRFQQRGLVREVDISRAALRKAK